MCPATMPERWSRSLWAARSVDDLHGRLQVWAVDVEPWLEARLPAAAHASELQRAARFVDPADGQRWLVGRLFLRAALGAHLGADPAGLELTMAPTGAPRLENTPLSFNVTHSSSHLVVAVGAGQPVGVDLEQIRPDHDLTNLLETLLAPEDNIPMGLPPAVLSASVLELWVRKEAVAKAVGLGLSMPLESFSVHPSDGTVVCAQDRSLEQLRVTDLDIWPGYVGAVAARHGSRIEVRLI